MVIEIVEVARRDGLQNVDVAVSTADKAGLVDRLRNAGLRRIEVTSFVNPARVPQMADADDVCAAVGPQPADSGLVLNVRGFQRALAAGLREVNTVVVVSETLCERNQGASTDQALDTWDRIAHNAREAGVRTAVTLAAAFGCPFEGEVAVGRLTDVAARAAASGPDEIVLADTIGVAVPSDVTQRLDAVRDVAGVARLRVHFHNTRNTGLANVAAAVDVGVTVLDASLGGVGGCPFAPDATGNVATEDVVYMLDRMGHDTGVDLDALCEAARWLSGVLGSPVPGLLSRAGGFPKSA